MAYDPPIVFIQEDYPINADVYEDMILNAVKKKCSVYIDADHLRSALYFDEDQYWKGVADGQNIKRESEWQLVRAPTVMANVRIRGAEMYGCRICHAEHHKRTKYCPDCGCKMLKWDYEFGLRVSND